LFRLAAVAGPPSPENAATPFPATTLITPVDARTSHTRFEVVSQMYRLSLASNERAAGVSCALVAGPPLPLLPAWPEPAYAVRVPRALLTLNTMC
jgi:hypothetical protein